MKFKKPSAPVLSWLILLSVILLAATSGDRLKNPVTIGNGINTSMSIVFDTNNGANNAKIVSTSNSSLAFALNGSTERTITTSSETTVLKQLGPDGALGAPVYSFASDPLTGLYLSSAGVLQVVANGAVASFSSGGIGVTADLGVNGKINAGSTAGTAAAPLLTFNNDTDTGFYQSGSNQVGVTAAGVQMASFSTSGIGVTGDLGVTGSLSTASGDTFRIKYVNLGTNAGSSGSLSAAHGLTSTKIRGIQVCGVASNSIICNGSSGTGATEVLASAGTTNVTVDWAGLAAVSRIYYATITYVP